MTAEQRLNLPKLANNGCFMCGNENPIGFNLSFYFLGGAVCTDVTLGRYHVGWENMAHGGIITALLDETMAWGVVYFKRSFFLTRKIEVQYLRPVLINIPLKIQARVLKDRKKSSCEMTAELKDPAERVLAEGKGKFVLLSKDKMSLMSDPKKDDMINLFESLPPR